MNSFGIFVLNSIQYLILFYFLWLNGLYCILLYYAAKFSYKNYQETQAENIDQILRSDSLPTLTFIVPAYNEARTIEQSLRTLLQLSYRYKQFIVVNDGSSDLTLDVLIHCFSLVKVPPFFVNHLHTQAVRSYYQSREYANLLVIDKVNGGSKADAINAGLNACTTSIFIVIDSDTIIEDKEFNALIRPFLQDSKTLVAGASVRVVNGCQIVGNTIVKYNFPSYFLPGMQCIEYLRAFYIGRMGWDWTNGNLIVSGAFGIFKTDEVVNAGGYDVHNCAEDMEVVVKLHRYAREAKKDYNVIFVPNPVAWTEVPEDWRSLARQRERWHRGLIQTLKKHRQMFLNPRYGIEGMVGFPFYVFGEMYAPIAETVGYLVLLISYLFDLVDWQFFWLFLAVSWGLTTLLSIAAVLIEEMTFRRYSSFKNALQLITLALLENFGYRQMTVWWRLKAFFPQKGKYKWANVKRKGFEA